MFNSHRPLFQKGQSTRIIYVKWQKILASCISTIIAKFCCCPPVYVQEPLKTAQHVWIPKVTLVDLLWLIFKYLKLLLYYINFHVNISCSLSLSSLSLVIEGALWYQLLSSYAVDLWVIKIVCARTWASFMFYSCRLIHICRGLWEQTGGTVCY